jgi:hypothetical protein
VLRFMAIHDDAWPATRDVCILVAPIHVVIFCRSATGAGASAGPGEGRGTRGSVAAVKCGATGLWTSQYASPHFRQCTSYRRQFGPDSTKV